MYVYMMLTTLIYVYYCNIIADFSQLHMEVDADHTYNIVIIVILVHIPASDIWMNNMQIPLIYNYHCYIIIDFC